MGPKPEFLGAVSLGGTEETEMRRKGYRVFFFLICRDDRLPNGKKLRFASPGPRRATTRIWGTPGHVYTPDELLTVFRAAMFNAWRRNRFGRDAWWYIEPQDEAEGMKWEGSTLRMPR